MISDQAAADWYSTDDLPIGWTPGSRNLWQSPDTFENYSEHGGHPLYSPTAIVYQHNRRGYRAPEFDATADLRVVAVGCSYCYGIGLPQDEIFVEIVGSELKRRFHKTTIVWNLGLSGTSHARMVHILAAAVHRLDPHLVLVNLTHPHRREILFGDARVAFNAAFDAAGHPWEAAYQHQRALASPADDAVNLIMDYRAMRAIIGQRCWLFSAICDIRQELSLVAAYLERERFVGYLERADLARDYSHPGRRSHEELARAYLERLHQMGWEPEEQR